MNSYLIRRRSPWATIEELEAATGRSGRVSLHEMPDRVRWVRTYVIREANGRLGSLCVFEATGPDAVREHARRASLPADEITCVVDTFDLQPVPLATA